MIRIALIGLGGISQSVHLPVLQRNRGVIDVVAAVELSAERLAIIADRYGIPGRYHSVAELVSFIRSGQLHLDAAILATPGAHAADALTLIEAGIRVLVEKPLAYSFEELDHLERGLVDLDRDPRDWLRVGYMKEYDPAVEAARDLLADLEVRQVGVEVLHPADASQIAFAHLEPPATDVPPEALEEPAARFARSLDAALGQGIPQRQRMLYSDVVLGSIIHDVALNRHLGLGLAEVIHARQWSERFPGSITAIGATGTGAPWTLGWHFISGYPEYSERVRVHHERGSVELEFCTPYVLNAPTELRVRTAGEGLEHSLQVRTWPQEEAFERELHALIDLANNHRPRGSGLAEARQDLTAAQALWKACAESAGIAVEPGCEAATQRG